MENTDQLYSINEAAKILGVMPSTLRSWRFFGTLSVIRIGPRLIKVPQSEIDRIISKGREPIRSGGK